MVCCMRVAMIAAVGSAAHVGVAVLGPRLTCRRNARYARQNIGWVRSGLSLRSTMRDVNTMRCPMSCTDGQLMMQRQSEHVLAQGASMKLDSVERNALVWLEAFVRITHNRPWFKRELCRRMGQRFDLEGPDVQRLLAHLKEIGYIDFGHPVAHRYETPRQRYSNLRLTEAGLAECTRYRLSCCEGHLDRDGYGLAFFAPCLKCGEQVDA